MTCCRRGTSNLCATLAVGLLLSHAAGALAQNGAQPTLRLDITQANPGSLRSCGGTPVLFSTAQGQLVMVRAIRQHQRLLGQRRPGPYLAHVGCI